MINLKIELRMVAVLENYKKNYYFEYSVAQTGGKKNKCIIFSLFAICESAFNEFIKIINNMYDNNLHLISLAVSPYYHEIHDDEIKNSALDLTPREKELDISSFLIIKSKQITDIINYVWFPVYDVQVNIPKSVFPSDIRDKDILHKLIIQYGNLKQIV